MKKGRKEIDRDHASFGCIQRRANSRVYSRWNSVTRAGVAWRIFSGRLIQILLSSAHDPATHRRPVIGGTSATRSSDWRVSLSERFLRAFGFYTTRHSVIALRFALSQELISERQVHDRKFRSALESRLSELIQVRDDLLATMNPA